MDETPDVPVAPPRPLPLLKVAVLASALFCNTFMSSMLLPFLTFMVDDFHIAPTPEEIGKYSGYLVSSFMIGQALFSYPWGQWSDAWGRRPVLVLGLLLTGISFLLFGFSKDYYVALCWRFLNGSVNGIVGVTMTYMSEITDESNQGQGFAILGVSRASGIILGPIVGGFMSMPVKKYPWIFKPGGLFDEYPYVLPCMFGFVVSMTGGCLAILVLEETKVNRHVESRSSQRRSIETGAPSNTNLRVTTNGVVPSGLNRTDSSETEISVEDDDVDDRVDESSRLLPSATTPPSQQPTSTSASCNTPAYRPPEPLMTMLKRPPVSISIIMYFMLNSIYIQYDETFVLWSRLPPSSGGLAFQSSEQGIVFTIGGVCLFLYQMLAYSYVLRRLGVLKTFQMGVWISLPGFAVISLASLLAGVDHERDGTVSSSSSSMVWAIVAPAQVLRTVGGLQAFTCMFVMMSNSVTSRSRGSLNGFGQMMGAIGRMVGPIIAGTLFSWSLQNGLDAPFDYHLNFVTIVIQQFLTFVLSLWVPSSIDSRPDEDEDDPEHSE